MPTLLCLPEEIVSHILAFLDPLDVRSCQQTCCALNSLIAASPRLLFSLALDSLGYTLPLIYRSNIEASEGLKLLQEHRLNWLHPNDIQPTQHNLRTQSVSSKYAGSVYVQGFGASGFLGVNSTIRDLDFYQLPSKNLGTGFRRWSIENLDPGVCDFVFHPDQDLLVLLELPSGLVQYSTTCNIHLKTMSDGEPHPRALIPTIIADFAQISGLEGTVPNWGYHFEVVGQILGILFRSRSKDRPSWVIVWDWVRGIEVTRVSTIGGWHSSFILLDRQTLLLPKSNDLRCASKFRRNNALGSIEVHAFDPTVDISTPPQMISSFGLPSLDPKYVQSTLKLRCTPNVRSACQSQGRPKAYESSSEHPLVAIDIHLSQLRGSNQITESAGTLYVPANVFLDYGRFAPETSALRSIINKIYACSAPEEPWDNWAGHTSWVDTGDSLANDDCLMYGYRMGTLSNRVGIIGPASRIHLLDFNQRRVKARKAKVPQIPSRISGKRSLKSLFGEGGAYTKAKYTETVLEVEGGVDIFDEVILDDEHIIVVRKGDLATDPSLLVYNF